MAGSGDKKIRNIEVKSWNFPGFKNETIDLPKSIEY